MSKRKQPIPQKEVQSQILVKMSDTFHDYKDAMRKHRDTMYQIYESYSTFKGKKQAAWKTAFKVNKAHEVVEKVLPRMIAKDPRWIVSTNVENTLDLSIPEGERGDSQKKNNEMAEAIQDYLTYVFDEYKLREVSRLWCKNMNIYGTSFAKAKFKFKTTMEKTPGGSSKKVSGQYPTLDVKSWTDMYYDPRYKYIDDMPSIIERTNAVRMSQLKKNKKFFNLDMVEKIAKMESFSRDEYKRAIFSLTGIDITNDTRINQDSMVLYTYYGYLNPDGKGERLFRATSVEDTVLIELEEIYQYPFEAIRAFEDPETFYGTGFVEPIIGIQDELNFKKNSASEYINHALNRSWIWSANSGIPPKMLTSRPNNIIQTNVDGPTALANIQELPHRELPVSFFQEQNDLERQIQSMSFTVDTSNPRSNQGLTNTATGIRVKFFESNSVIDEIRKHFEEGLERIAYKLLMETFDNIQGNIAIRKTKGTGFWDINKELLRDAVSRYVIKVEANSSAFDDIENRREDSIALYNLMLQAKGAGVPVNLEEGFKDILKTFEKREVERFIESNPAPQQGQEAQQGGGGSPLSLPSKGPSTPQELTQQVAKSGGLF